MRTFLRTAALVLMAATATSCLAGPHQLRRSIDDWDHKQYVNSPWWNVALWSLGIMPASYAGAFVGDLLITDAYAFWFDDAWDGAGTAFQHLPVQETDGHMSSLWIERSGWTRIEK